MIEKGKFRKKEDKNFNKTLELRESYILIGELLPILGEKNCSSSYTKA